MCVCVCVCMCVTKLCELDNRSSISTVMVFRRDSKNSSDRPHHNVWIPLVTMSKRVRQVARWITESKLYTLCKWLDTVGYKIALSDNQFVLRDNVASVITVMNQISSPALHSPQFCSWPSPPCSLTPAIVWPTTFCSDLCKLMLSAGNQMIVVVMYGLHKKQC